MTDNFNNKKLTFNNENCDFSEENNQFKLSHYNFAVDLLKKFNDNNNLIFSPLTNIFALSQLLMGADGKSFDELKEFTFAFENIHKENKKFIDYLFTICDENNTFNIANSLWINNQDKRFKANDNYLDNIDKFYNSKLYLEKFDNNLVEKINNWVKKETDGTIEKIVDNINDNTVSYLLSALSFNGIWENIYSKDKIYFDDFINNDGSISKTKFMTSKENVYLEDEKFHGIIKGYKDGKFAFFALKSKDESAVNEYIEALNGEKLINLFKNKSYQSVDCHLPEFEIEREINIKNHMINSGVKSIFSEKDANLKKIGSSTYGNIFVGDILHKSKIKVSERGTEAGAVTSVMICDRCAIFKPVEITFNKPFIFGIIDSECEIPLFMGVLNNL